MVWGFVIHNVACAICSQSDRLLLYPLNNVIHGYDGRLMYNYDLIRILHYISIRFLRLFLVRHDARGPRSASSPNSPIVRTTRSTFSRYAFTTSRARRIVSVLKVLSGFVSNYHYAEHACTHATRTSSSTCRTRLTACGCSSLSTSITCFAMEA